jgi:hypothetical protein
VNALPRPGAYIFAGSAYALKENGTLGYASTTAGEWLDGQGMESFGFPALHAMGLNATAMIYFTHYSGISIVLKNPKPFVDAVVAKVVEQGLVGADLDYEPQNVQRAVDEIRAAEGAAGAADPFFAFLGLLGTALGSKGLLLTVDAETGCGGTNCPAYASTPGLTAVNTMDTFNIQSLADFQSATKSDLPGLEKRWAPGFEPGNFGGDGSLYKSVLTWAAANGVTNIATWAIHEWNVGPQPQGLFDAINAFLDAP